MTRALDTAEAVVNATVGLAVSIATVQLVWPLFGWAVTATQSAAVAALFWALSTVRGYAVRRLFRRLA